MQKTSFYLTPITSLNKQIKMESLTQRFQKNLMKGKNSIIKIPFRGIKRIKNLIHNLLPINVKNYKK